MLRDEVGRLGSRGWGMEEELMICGSGKGGREVKPVLAKASIRRTWKRGKKSEKRARLTTGSELFKLVGQHAQLARKRPQRTTTTKGR